MLNSKSSAGKKATGQEIASLIEEGLKIRKNGEIMPNVTKTN